jgi:hypothetical protein
MRSDHMSEKRDCDAAVASMTKMYLAVAFVTVMGRM